MNMKQDLLRCLPSVIIMDILSRLPPQSIISCKCVCKWLHDLIETREFTEFHLSKSKSVSGLAIAVLPNTLIGKTIQLTNILHLCTITIFSFIDQPTRIEGSADGLLLLKTSCNQLYLCNPITREYINLCSHIRPFEGQVINYGFGVSKISGQYKAVSICMVRTTSESDCKVYTIGTGCWRSIAPQAYIYTNERATFVNGNLHWFVRHINDGTPLISCFDLETELFTTFSVPNEMCGMVLAAAEDSLCLCDCKSSIDLVTIWKMKEYGNEKSWTKEFVITHMNFRYINPIAVSKDGVILMTIPSTTLLYYSTKNKTCRIICDSRVRFCYVSSLSHAPSFVSLKCFSKEENIQMLDL